MTTSLAPNWMLQKGESSAPQAPTVETRIFRGNRMTGWLGYVRIKDVKYWDENRRTDLQIMRLKHEHRGQLTNDQMVDALIDDPDLDIKRLAEDILLNELRQPLVLSNEGELLDGNRRYLAHKWIEKNGRQHERQQFAIAKAWVLTEENSNHQNKNHVVTEFNFLDDFRKEWSDFVKAKFLFEVYHENDYSYDTLFQLFGGPGFSRNKIREFIKTYEVIVMFIESSSDPEMAEQTAADNFIWFQQLQRSYTDIIRNDDEFREVIYENIREGNIQKTDQLKNLKSMQEIREAWKLFRDGDVDRAHITRQVVEGEAKRRDEPDNLMTEINGRLERLIALERGLERVASENLTLFHELAQQIPGQVSNMDMRIGYTVRQLDTITSTELAELNDEYLAGLEKVLHRVIRQIRSTRGE